MKNLIIIFYVTLISSATLFAQAKLDITRVDNLPDTVTLHEIRNVSVKLQNIGNTAFSGIVYFDVKIDSTNGSGGSPVFIRIDSVFANLQSFGGLDSNIAFATIPIELPAGFKVGGNGNTVVIWPRAKNLSIPYDSIMLNVHVKDAPVSIADLGSFTSELTIYPNPTKNCITIQSKQIETIRYYKICDVSGRMIEFKDFSSHILFLNYHSGLYFIEFYDEQHRKLVTKKIIVE